jgi:S-adenosyl-L-methionine hydrolase (adenosine-forming)
MSLVTLITDFGIKEGNVGVMKGVIWEIVPHVQIADISHLVSPQNIAEAALILARTAPYFPGGTIHVVVVDPGVGTQRRPLAVILGTQRFVLPDNGSITMVLERAEREGLPVLFFHLDQPKFWRKEISHVFHGRDIFAPVAGHLASGQPIEAMGQRIEDPIRLSLPQPRLDEDGWRGEVIHIDHFGNLSTNILFEHLGWKPGVTILLGGASISGLAHTFGEKPPGSLVALYGSNGNLIVCVVNGSAAVQLGAQVGDPVEVRFNP